MAIRRQIVGRRHDQLESFATRVSDHNEKVVLSRFNTCNHLLNDPNGLISKERGPVPNEIIYNSGDNNVKIHDGGSPPRYEYNKQITAEVFKKVCPDEINGRIL